jgi:hypothetical protein
MAVKSLIGSLISSGGIPGVFLGYRRQQNFDTAGKVTTPPDKIWLLVCDLGPLGIVNHYPSEVMLAQTGKPLPTPPAQEDILGG